MSYTLTGLTAGTLYNVAVTAVDSLGIQSACSSVASAVARAEFAVSPTGTVNFGTVNVGAYADQVVTVSNTGGGTISGSAAVAAPFTVVSGSPFTLSGAGATRAVTVRFTPVTNTTVSANLSITASGVTLSSTLLGSGTNISSTADTTAPSVTIKSPTTSSTFTASGSTLTLGGTASDNVGVTQVTWTNSQGVSGTATGTTTWSTGEVALLPGSNTLTVSARDAAGNTGRAVLTVTVSNVSSASTDSPVISQSTLKVGPSSVKIGWITNKPSDTQVVYGPTTSYGSWTTLDKSLVTSHSQEITGLAPRTWYHFQMRSKDAAGKLTVSGDVKFKTRGRGE